jgi:hypothetical protein
MDYLNTDLRRRVALMVVGFIAQVVAYGLRPVLTHRVYPALWKLGWLCLVPLKWATFYLLHSIHYMILCFILMLILERPVLYLVTYVDEKEGLVNSRVVHFLVDTLGGLMKKMLGDYVLHGIAVAYAQVSNITFSWPSLG